MKREKRLSNILCFLLGNVSGWILNKIIYSNRSVDEKNKKYYQLFDKWLTLNEHGNRIEEYFRARGMNEIAVYGYGNIGRHLVTQLLGTEVIIKYIIDKANRVTDYGMVVYDPTDMLPEVDAVIVTPICEYQEIKSALQEQISCQVISIEDILYELL